MTTSSLTAATRRREIVPDRMPRPSETPLPPRRLVDSLDWDTALALYTEHCEARGLRPTTINNYMSYLRQLAKWVDVEPARVTYAQLLAVQTLKVAVSTKQRRRTAFQLFFSWLLTEGYALNDPAQRLPKVRVPRTTPRPISVSQLEDILEVCRKRSTRTMILLGAYAGLRARIHGWRYTADNGGLVYASASQLLGLSEAETARLARIHGWRYTADNGGLVYAISDVEATARGMNVAKASGEDVLS